MRAYRGRDGNHKMAHELGKQPKPLAANRFLKTVSLITRRSQVQILPPPPSERPGNSTFPGLCRCWLREAIYRVVYRPNWLRLVDLQFRDGGLGRCLPAVGDELGELVGGCCAHSGEQVLVGVHRETWVEPG